MPASVIKKQDPKIFWRWLTILFFIAYFLLGVIVFDDYGVSVDESFQIKKAQVNLDYITGKNKELLDYDDRHYGAILAIQLEYLGQYFPDSRDNFLLRHFYTFFLFYLSSIYLFALLRKSGMETWVALIGAVLYVFHPHIFSHSFYNIKDIPFLAFVVFALYTLFLFLEKKTWQMAVLHGAMSGLVVVMRLPGIYLWGLTFVAWGWVFISGVNKWWRWVLVGALYAIVTISALIFYMPALWHDPYHELRTFLSMSLFTWPHKELFMGQFLSPEQYPWYYLPVYFIVTTPIAFLSLYLVGWLGWITDRKKWNILKDEQAFKLFLLIVSFLGPLVILILTKPVIYNGWRHAFFIYPGFVALCALGGQYLFQASSKVWHSVYGKVMVSIGLALALYSLITLAAFFINSHPLEHVYYNRFAGQTLGVARVNYAMDYWGLADRQALEEILRKDSREKIRVTGIHPYLAEENWKILPKADRKRLVIVGKDEPYDYFIEHFRTRFKPIMPGNELFIGIYVEDALINATFKPIP